jgi:hypothetical protein
MGIVHIFPDQKEYHAGGYDGKENSYPVAVPGRRLFKAEDHFGYYQGNNYAYNQLWQHNLKKGWNGAEEIPVMEQFPVILKADKVKVITGIPEEQGTVEPVYRGEITKTASPMKRGAKNKYARRAW